VGDIWRRVCRHVCCHVGCHVLSALLPGSDIDEVIDLADACALLRDGRLKLIHGATPATTS
jgi:hypothetical protein